jgi:hypothetical protein
VPSRNTGTSAKLRPSGPEGSGSDGALVLYDAVNEREYDFFRV